MQINKILRIIFLFAAVSLLSVNLANAQTRKAEHIVKPGETLFAIAAMYDINVHVLRSANPGISDNIVTGQTIIIPAGSGSNLFHTIAPKETLFSISRKYNVEIAKIVSANPGLNEQNFKAGQTIIIPVDKNSAAGMSAPAPKKRGIAGSNCSQMYKVKKKDTFFSIAKKFNLSVTELAAANPEISAPDFKLSKGDFVCIPFTTDELPAVDNKQAFAQGPKAAPKSKVSIALVMPFYDKGANGKRAITFYRGLLAAADSLRKGGASFEVTAKDAGATAADMTAAIADGSLNAADMVIASAGNEALKTLASHCKTKGVRLFLPFNAEADNVFNNSQIILAGQPESYLQVATVQYFNAHYGDANIIYVDSKNGDNTNNYTRQLVTSLKVTGRAFKTVTLNASDADFFKAFDNNRRNVLVLSSHSRDSYAALAKRLDYLAASLGAVDFCVFGHKEWADFDFALRKTFHKYDVSILTQQYINVYAGFYNRFLAMYKGTFKQAPTTADQRSFLQGFDFGMYMLAGLTSYGAGFATQPIKTTPVERPISFARINNWGGMVNKAFRVVRFTKFNTTEITDHAQ